MMKALTIDRLHAESQRLKSLFGWAVGLGAFLLFSQILYVPLKGLIFAIGTPDMVGASAMIMETAVRSLPAVALIAALWTARQLFEVYSGGTILSARGGRLIGRVGDWLTVSAILALAVGPANDRMDAVTGAYITTQIALICVGLAIRLLGRVQAVAADIAADHAQIV
ncbi:MAG: hypothetical protein B7Y49_06595 [Sphingomonas sp. 28-62-11]|nr:MAG: hypothetical protein B7Y49_06595 [Sphingomonas sp. 28-62-11]